MGDSILRRGYQIYGRMFQADGCPFNNNNLSSTLVNSFVVNQVAAGQQRKPAVSMNRGGRFAVAWEDDQEKDGKARIVLRQFDPFLELPAPKFISQRVLSLTSGRQPWPRSHMEIAPSSHGSNALARRAL